MIIIPTPTSEILIKEAVQTENPELYIVGIIRVLRVIGADIKNLIHYLNEGHEIDMTKVNKVLENIKVDSIYNHPKP